MGLTDAQNWKKITNDKVVPVTECHNRKAHRRHGGKHSNFFLSRHNAEVSGQLRIALLLTINNFVFCVYVFRTTLTVNSDYFLKQR
jgi:hypothetical protein